MGYIDIRALDFLKRISHINDEQEWSVEYDDRYDIKYSFYWGHPKYGGIISPLTLFEYGRRVVTLTRESLEFIQRAEIKVEQSNP